MLRDATFSPCRTWRYSLKREWLTGEGKTVMIMLNPSKADDQRDDATTTLMVRRAQRDGFKSYEAVNLFALVDTYPKGLYGLTLREAVGPHADAAIMAAAVSADRIIVAWGNHGGLHNRAEIVVQMLEEFDLWCFGVTASGMPRFPRAIRMDAPLMRFN